MGSVRGVCGRQAGLLSSSSDHKKLESTEIYTNIEHNVFKAGANDEFTVKVAEKSEEIKSLLEVGFEYVLQKDNLIFLSKRK
jgi:hypothetical protein